MMRVGINGAAGRMGRLLCARVLSTPDLELAAATDISNFVGQDIGELVGLGSRGLLLTEPSSEGFADCDVVIDFSLPEGTDRLMTLLNKQALVIGTTGLDEAGAIAIGT